MESLFEIAITIIIEFIGEFAFDTEVPRGLRLVCSVIFWGAILAFCAFLIIMGITTKKMMFIIIGVFIILCAIGTIVYLLRKRKKS